VHEVAHAIRDYLMRHPQAVDTASGIQRWWLLPVFGEVSLVIVEAALASLEQQGEVRKLEEPWREATYLRVGP